MERHKIVSIDLDEWGDKWLVCKTMNIETREINDCDAFRRHNIEDILERSGYNVEYLDRPMSYYSIIQSFITKTLFWQWQSLLGFS